MITEEDLLAEIRQSNRWLRILALPTLRERLVAELTKPELRKIYDESDGRPIRKVAASAKAGFGTVQGHWQEWAAKGLMEPTDTAGRFRKVIDLKDVGLEV